jgi:hypothetical protein
VGSNPASYTDLDPILPTTIFSILHIFVRFSLKYEENSYKFVKKESYQFFQISVSII